MVVVQQLLLLLVLLCGWMIGRKNGNLVVVSASSSSAAQTETLIGIVGRDFVLLGADSSLGGRSIALTATNVDKIAILTNPFPQVPSSPSQLQSKQTTETTIPRIQQQRRQQQQQTIAAAVAGDTAAADQFVGYLKAYGTIQEYEAGVGSDVEYAVLGETSSSSFSSSSLPLTTTVPPQTPSPGLSVASMAHLARELIYNRLRTTDRWNVCALIAGMMPEPTGFETSNDDGDEEEDDDPQHQQQQNLEESMSARIRTQVQRALSSTSTTPVSALPGTKETTLEQEEHSEGIATTAASATTAANSWSLCPHLYWLDEYGSFQRMKEYGVHGLASAFVWSILDQNYQPDMNLEQAHQLMHHCFDQLRQRYLINHHAGRPCIKCIDQHGCRLLL